MIKKTTLILTFLFSFFSQIASAQDKHPIEQTFSESGKINVVVAVVLVIFIGLIFYLIKLDRKISKIEKDL